MNSSHHANRTPGRGQDANLGRGRGGRSRGSFNPRVNFDTDSPAVPTISQVVPGAPVSIVLKADQPTGRQVQGFVGALLTRGNHPRGIKVRLQDGRVGRVQKMASEEAAKAGSEGRSYGLGRDGDGHGDGMMSMHLAEPSPAGLSMGSSMAPNRYGDFRLDAPEEPPRAELSLGDYVVVKGNGKKGQQRKTGSDSGDPTIQHLEVLEGIEPQANPGSTSVTSTCPVCGDFEGDEIAISHHVNSHFD
ncbi:hypothetical protein LZ554_001235 [Drepanopeziza brunnea f. sp. 'monogermtubi']|nr:hypothetical protein LZ554_001235 [Drepanopeziza brunnea f. sp. 'monogermtubi']